MHDDRVGKLAERYNREASAYRDLWAPVLRVAGRRLLRELEDTGVRRAVDVGTGVGLLLEDLRAVFPGAFILGIDRSRGMLVLAPPEVPCVVGDARQLPVVSGSVDLAVFAFILFHLEKPEYGLREARRILRSGGSVATVTWGGDLESNATRIWTTCLGEYGAAEPDPATEARHEAINTPEKMELLLRSIGFTAVRAWTEDLVSMISLEHLLSLRTRMGSEKARFDSLPDGAREACVGSARCRMEALSAEDFVARGQVVYSVAR
jgi:ubiquinone/menaquinone biosynthesis C-methylase UbiE